MSGVKTKLSEVDKEVIRYFAEAGLNANKAARISHYHRNTIEYHIASIRELTGLDPRNFFDFCKLYEIAIKEIEEE